MCFSQIWQVWFQHVSTISGQLQLLKEWKTVLLSRSRSAHHFWRSASIIRCIVRLQVETPKKNDETLSRSLAISTRGVHLCQGPHSAQLEPVAASYSRLVGPKMGKHMKDMWHSNNLRYELSITLPLLDPSISSVFCGFSSVTLWRSTQVSILKARLRLRPSRRSSRGRRPNQRLFEGRVETTASLAIRFYHLQQVIKRLWNSMKTWVSIVTVMSFFFGSFVASLIALMLKQPKTYDNSVHETAEHIITYRYLANGSVWLWAKRTQTYITKSSQTSQTCRLNTR